MCACSTTTTQYTTTSSAIRACRPTICVFECGLYVATVGWLRHCGRNKTSRNRISMKFLFCFSLTGYVGENLHNKQQ